MANTLLFYDNSKGMVGSYRPWDNGGNFTLLCPITNVLGGELRAGRKLIRDSYTLEGSVPEGLREDSTYRPLDLKEVAEVQQSLEP